MLENSQKGSGIWGIRYLWKVEVQEGWKTEGLVESLHKKQLEPQIPSLLWQTSGFYSLKIKAELIQFAELRECTRTFPQSFLLLKSQSASSQVYSPVTSNFTCQLCWAMGCPNQMFWVFLRVFLMRLTFKSVDSWVKQITHHNVGGPHSISWRPIPNKKTSSPKQEYSPPDCRLQMNSNWNISSPGSPACRPTLQMLDLWVSIIMWANPV